jgi:hypothetical protein
MSQENVDLVHQLGKEIQPDAKLVGTVIYDLPAQAARNLRKRSSGGNLDIINFEERQSGKEQIGIIRLYR